jgi:peroxiredoxin
MSNNNRDSISGNRLVFLIDRLGRIQHARTPVELETAMHEFRDE